MKHFTLVKYHLCTQLAHLYEHLFVTTVALPLPPRAIQTVGLRAQWCYLRFWRDNYLCGMLRQNVSKITSRVSYDED